MKKYLIIYYCILSLLFSCSPDNTIESGGQTEHIPAGAYEEDCKWIYSQMNHDYYWRAEMPDSMSCDYGTDPVTFYKSLLSKKDRFSYCDNNPSFTGIVESPKYGFEYQNYMIGETIFSQILYVWDNNIKKQGLKRGDLIQFIDNCNISRGMIEGGRFVPSDTLMLSNALIDNNNSVYLDSIYLMTDNRIGYLCYMQFESQQDLEPIIKKFWENNINELILDLRYNPGGYVNTCKYLTNSIAPECAYGNVFQYCTYNDILTAELIKETGADKSVSNYSIPNNGNGIIGSALYGLKLKRLFVLTSKYTASASEATIICLKPYMDVILIGEQTYGKGVGSWTIRDNRFKYQIQPITMRYHNANMESTPDDGIPVDFFIEDGYSTSKKELGDINEPLLKKALSIINEGNSVSKSKEIEYLPNIYNIKQLGNPSFFNKNDKKNENNL